MRWLGIRKAKIDRELREIFEQYGVGTMQSILATTNYIRKADGRPIPLEQFQADLLPWLTEEYDKAERKETWSLTMEVVITIFVVLEVVHFHTIISWLATKL